MGRRSRELKEAYGLEAQIICCNCYVDFFGVHLDGFAYHFMYDCWMSGEKLNQPKAASNRKHQCLTGR